MADNAPTLLSRMGQALTGVLRKDVSAAVQRLTGVQVMPAGSTAPARGTEDYLTSYGAMPWLRAVGARVSYDVAAAPWELYVSRDKSGRAVRNKALQRARAPQLHGMVRRDLQAGTLTPVLDHPLLDLLDTFNPVHTGLTGRRVTQLHIDLAGEAFWMLERGVLNQPTALWPLSPAWVTRLPTARQPTYEVTIAGWKGEVPVTEMLWFCDVDPAKPYGRGVGTARALGDELETDEFAAKHVKQFYFNRARPDLVVWPKGEGTIQEANVRRLEEGWTRQSAGFWRSFKPFFISQGVEVKELSQDFRSQQLVQLREFERNTILQVFGVSPETLGILSTGSNRATVTMGDQIYARRVQVPRLELLRAVMQERLVPMFDERLVLSYVSPVTSDRELDIEAAKAAPWALTTDEWRGLQGRGPLEDKEAGKAHMSTGMVQRVSFDEAEPLALPTDPLADPPGAEDDEDLGEDPGQEDADYRALLAAGDDDMLLDRRKATTKAEDDPAPTRLADRQVAGYRKEQETRWEQLGASAPEDALVRAVAAQDADAVVEAFGGDRAFTRAMSDVCEGRSRTAFLRGAELASAGLPPGSVRQPIAISLQDFNPEAARWAERRAARLIVGVPIAVRNNIRALIARAHRDGLTPQVVAKLIRAQVGLLPRQLAAVDRYVKEMLGAGLPADVAAKRAARYTQALVRQRATLIARTELMASTNAGQQALWEHAQRRGLLPKAGLERIWIVTLDDALDLKICAPLTDARAKMNEPFQPGGYMLPPAHPGCRCTVGLVPAKAPLLPPVRPRSADEVAR